MFQQESRNSLSRLEKQTDLAVSAYYFGLRRKKKDAREHMALFRRVYVEELFYNHMWIPLEKEQANEVRFKKGVLYSFNADVRFYVRRDGSKAFSLKNVKRLKR
jgi:hypothetical protein